jgi:hypothetical protein
MEFSSAPFQSNDAGRLTNETLTVLEAARRVGVTQSAIIRWIRNGYLSATPSANGWQIPAHMLEDAARSADEARGTGPVPRQTTPTLAPAPTPIRRSFETRAIETAAQTADIGESIVTPLAELIRDQIDVVHDQAEVIGWLQSERSRLAAELSILKGAPASHSPAADTTESESAPAPDKDLYDEVLSLLWKDADDVSDDGQDAAIVDDPAPVSAPEPEPDLAVADEFSVTTDTVSNQPVLAEPWPFTPVEPPRSDQPDDPTTLRLEDYADPSWFFENYNTGGTAGGNTSQDRPTPVLQPIVRRGSEAKSRSVETNDDEALHQMIDETERKIAELWDNEEKLKSTPRFANGTKGSAFDSNRSRETMWHRLWPLRR